MTGERLLEQYEKAKAKHLAWERKVQEEHRRHKEAMEAFGKRPSAREWQEQQATLHGVTWERVRQIVKEYRHNDDPERKARRPDEPRDPRRDRSIVKAWEKFELEGARDLRKRDTEQFRHRLAISKLNQREPAATLEALAKRYGLSRQRVHQLITKARRAREAASQCPECGEQGHPASQCDMEG